MSDYTGKIINYIDDNLSKKESDELIINLEKNKELKDEFLLVKEINGYMNGKLVSESIESGKDYVKIEKEAREDVNDFLNSEKKDSEILEYLSSAFPEKDIALSKKLNEIEKEAKKTGIDKDTEDWINELNEEEKDPELIKFINSTLSDKSKQTNISFEKGKSDFGKKKTIGRRKLYLWTASAAVILIFMLLFNNIFDTRSENERIFAKCHTHPQELMSIQVRNTEQDIKHVFNDASELYNQRKYNEAFILFSRLTTEDKNFVQAYFYSGLSQFEAKKYSESIQIFNKVISDFDEYELESKWFISLSYIKINKIKKALPFLIDLSKQKSIYQEDAKEILQEIDE